MEKQKTKQKGITLIALVISIIVMLILAGVSLNMTIGENGIITKAQEANYMQSVSAIEEFLNLYYTSHYEEITKDDNKALALSNYTGSSSWFVKTSTGYVVDKNGKAHLFLIPENMPSEISEVISGGKGEGKDLGDYILGNDVYGVTSDLKVYYCKGNIETPIGQNYADLPYEDPTRELFPAESAWAKIVNDGKSALTVADMKSITELEITENSGISSLADLYNFTSLKRLTLRNVTMTSLDGLDNIRDLQYLYMENINVESYTALNKLTKLESIYVLRSDNSEESDNTSVNNMLTAMSGVNYTSLKNFAIFGNDSTDQTIQNSLPYYTSKTKISSVSNISAFANLTSSTKESIQNLYLNNNKISDFSCLEDCKNIKLLRIENNLATNLNFMINMNNIIRVFASNNKLTDITVFENNSFSKMEYVNIRDNATLLNCKSLENLNGLISLMLLGCTNLNILDVQEIADFYNARTYKSIDSKYTDYIQGTTARTYDNKNLTDTSDQILAMQNMSEEDKLKVQQISLINNPNLTDDCLNNLLKSGFTNLVSLDVTGCTKLENLDFLEGLPNLKELIIRDTGIIGDKVKKIDDYCTKIVCFSANTNIDLTKMQKTISKCNPASISYTKKTYGGLYISSNLVPQLANCTEITSLRNYGMEDYDGIVDLTGCTKLETAYIYSSSAKLILPYGVTKLRLQSCTVPDVTNAINSIQQINVDRKDISMTESDMTTMFIQLATSTSLKNVTINLGDIEFDFSGIKYLSKSSVQEIKIKKYYSDVSAKETIKKIDLRKDENYIEGTPHFDKLTSILLESGEVGTMDKFKDCVNLEKIDMQNCQIEDISALENMPNLTTLNLANNSISNLYGLRNATKLSSLNLNNNNIYNKVYDTRISQNVDNASIIENLNEKGALKDLHLLNNKIDDFSVLNSLKFNIKEW